MKIKPLSIYTLTISSSVQFFIIYCVIGQSLYMTRLTIIKKNIISTWESDPSLLTLPLVENSQHILIALPHYVYCIIHLFMTYLSIFDPTMERGLFILQYIRKEEIALSHNPNCFRKSRENDVMNAKNFNFSSVRLTLW